MTIQIWGNEGTAEYGAALALRTAIVDVWPDILQQPEEITLVVGAKCHGQQIRDIDILLLAHFPVPRTFRCFLPFVDRYGNTQTPDNVSVRSLCTVIEVKDHGPQGVRFVGTSAQVRYPTHWHDATEQNEKQKFAVKGYLESHAIVPPWLTALLWLRNVPATELPPRPHTIVGAQMTWELLLNILVQVTPPRKRGGEWEVDAFGESGPSLARTLALFTKVLEPTNLDRTRVERMTRQALERDTTLEAIGEKSIIFRGRGGTGKTMRLLQIAYHLCTSRGDRILVLTYNKALVADLRRLLAIIGMSDDPVGGTIQIQTVHSFLNASLDALGLPQTRDTPFFEDYEQRKDEALMLLESGALTLEDVRELASADGDLFRWDYVFVDEAQDWPPNEQRLLHTFYTPGQLIVADGVDQLVRSTTHADWRGDLKPHERLTIPLSASLRMKTGLARFVAAFAMHLGIAGVTWDTANGIPGGRVVIVDTPYFTDRALHDSLCRDTESQKNALVDMLFCVPPNLVMHQPDGTARSVAAKVFSDWGYQVWDGASEDVRDGYPTGTDQLRIVQYDSCRGLEGWTTVNFALDSFYAHKLHTALPSDASNPLGSMGDEAEYAHKHAARWVLIPLTRAIDTLVIHLQEPHSPIRDALMAASREYSDYVTWTSAMT